MTRFINQYSLKFQNLQNKDESHSSDIVPNGSSPSSDRRDSDSNDSEDDDDESDGERRPKAEEEEVDDGIAGTSLAEESRLIR